MLDIIQNTECLIGRFLFNKTFHCHNLKYFLFKKGQEEPVGELELVSVSANGLNDKTLHKKKNKYFKNVLDATVRIFKGDYKGGNYSGYLAEFVECFMLSGFGKPKIGIYSDSRLSVDFIVKMYKFDFVFNLTLDGKKYLVNMKDVCLMTLEKEKEQFRLEPSYITVEPLVI